MSDFTVVPNGGLYTRMFKDTAGNWRSFSFKVNDDQTASFYLDGEPSTIEHIDKLNKQKSFLPAPPTPPPTRKVVTSW